MQLSVLFRHYRQPTGNYHVGFSMLFWASVFYFGHGIFFILSVKLLVGFSVLGVVFLFSLSFQCLVNFTIPLVGGNRNTL